MGKEKVSEVLLQSTPAVKSVGEMFVALNVIADQ